MSFSTVIIVTTIASLASVSSAIITIARYLREQNNRPSNPAKIVCRVSQGDTIVERDIENTQDIEEITELLQRLHER